MAMPNQKPTTFTPFAQLPLELRQQIWSIACSTPRNVDVWWVRAASSVGWPVNQGQAHRFRSNSAIPSVLHACCESRSVGLQHYILGFGWHYESNGFEFLMPPQIYVNPAVDRMCDMGRSLGTVCVSLKFYMQCKELGVSRIAIAASRSKHSWEVYQIGDVLERAPEVVDVVIFEHDDELDVEGVIEFEEIGEGYIDMDEERRHLFLSVASKLFREDALIALDRASAESEEDLEYAAVRLSDRLRYAQLCLNGIRR